MKIPRDVTMAGFARYQVSLVEKQLNRLKQEVGLLGNDRLRNSQQNFKIRRKYK